MENNNYLVLQKLSLVRKRWDHLFRNADKPMVLGHSEEHWISLITKNVYSSLYGDILEIGCGIGADTQYIAPKSRNLTVFDISVVALTKIAKFFPNIGRVNGILPAVLPFRNSMFDTVVAGLSLHYFPWNETIFVMEEIHRVLRVGGFLIIRVNSTANSNYGYQQGPEIEPGYFFHKDHHKRFFTEEDIKNLFNIGWTNGRIISHIDQRFENPRHTLIAIFQKL